MTDADTDADKSWPGKGNLFSPTRRQAHHVNVGGSNCAALLQLQFVSVSVRPHHVTLVSQTIVTAFSASSSSSIPKKTRSSRRWSSGDAAQPDQHVHPLPALSGGHHRGPHLPHRHHLLPGVPVLPPATTHFDALLSERWNHSSVSENGIRYRLNLKVLPSAGSHRSRSPFDAHIAVIWLLHSLDFSGEIGSVSDALDMLPVAMELLFDDCVRACVRFLEAVPWTEEEEEGVLNLMPLLRREECENLLARILPIVSEEADGNCTSEEMKTVRMNLVKCWLPVLNVCRDIIFTMPTGQKSIIQDLEEAFLSIISTLPLSDSQDLLQQCVSFSTRNIEDCPHLISAFKTWFR
ncbi:uncharacterized protein LOC141821711 [Curcuma longa]|uniref:uncharacterized protein LOC141821711 n=1 Tax=Curcuma longa TaxID=136217 RepID=UPI003D9E4690